MYREVCSTCHSIKFIAFRNLIGVSHTEAEVRTGPGCLLFSATNMCLVYIPVVHVGRAWLRNM